MLSAAYLFVSYFCYCHFQLCSILVWCLYIDTSYVLKAFLTFILQEVSSPRILGSLFEHLTSWCFYRAPWLSILVPSPIWTASKKPLWNSPPINSTSSLLKTPCPPNWTNFFRNWSMSKPITILPWLSLCWLHHRCNHLNYFPPRTTPAFILPSIGHFPFVTVPTLVSTTNFRIIIISKINSSLSLYQDGTILAKPHCHSIVVQRWNSPLLCLFPVTPQAIGYLLHLIWCLGS